MKTEPAHSVDLYALCRSAFQFCVFAHDSKSWKATSGNSRRSAVLHRKADAVEPFVHPGGIPAHALPCAHPGVEKIAESASTINPHIHFIVGGLHLVVTPDPGIERIVTALHDRFKVDYIAPGHCTGEPAFAALQRAFGDHYVYAGLGATLKLPTSSQDAQRH